MRSPAWSGRAFDRVAQAYLVERADQVQPLFDQPAEARVLGGLGQPVASHRHQDRSAGGLAGELFEEGAPLLGVIAQREDLLRLVDCQHGVGSGVPWQRRE